MKPKKCRACHKPFTPTRPLQVACSISCALTLGLKKQEKAQAKAEKAERARIKERKEAIKTVPELLREAQAAFNRFIRLRDKDQPCICCGNPLEQDAIGGGYDAGHYRSVGSAPQHRFNESNVHAQRKFCNRYGAGRAVDYRIGLINRIGLDRVEALENDNAPHKWTKEELRELIQTYKRKAKDLE